MAMSHVAVASACAAAIACSGCMVGPAYHRPDAPMPAAFKEAPPEGWKLAQPGDAIPRGAWWTIYNNAELNGLEDQVRISNQNVLAAMAQYRQAADEIRLARAALFPTIVAAPAATLTHANTAARSSSGAIVTGASGAGSIVDYSLPVEFSYQADVWGSIRGSVRAATDTAQASAADLENARLVYQAQLAQAYFALHGLDGDADLLQTTLQLYGES